MRVIEIAGGAGPAEALGVAERPDPVAGPGQIRVRVRAAGVNRPDLVQRLGLYPPPPGASDILGLEVAGEVDQVGDGVTRWTVGDRVCALLGGGGYADLAVVDARHALPIPAGMDVVEAAGLPETVCTVFANVFEAGALKAGDTLLIHGATSGIGVTAIQMAKAAGARVIATSRGPEKAQAARALGADLSLDARTDDLEAAIAAFGGADVVLDMVGADYAAEPCRAETLRPLGGDRDPVGGPGLDRPDAADAEADRSDGLDPARAAGRREGAADRGGGGRRLALGRLGPGPAAGRDDLPPSRRQSRPPQARGGRPCRQDRADDLDLDHQPRRDGRSDEMLSFMPMMVRFRTSPVKVWQRPRK
jgi:NADPH2:quinone reductase